jgi:hypothetical protein
VAEGKFSQEKFLAELEALGVDKVRSYVETGHYGTVSQKGPLAKEWLRQKDQSFAERAAKRDAIIKMIKLITAIVAAVATAVAAIVGVIRFLWG